MPARSPWGYQEDARDRAAHYVVLLATTESEARGESIVRKCMKDPEPYLRKAWTSHSGKDVRRRLLHAEKILLTLPGGAFGSILQPPRETRAELRKKRLAEGDSNDA